MKAEAILDILLTPERTLGLYNQSVDVIETETIIKDFEKLKDERKPFFLTYDDFERVLHWKLRNQYHRGASIRQLNNEEIIQIITAAAFAINSVNDEYNVELKINLLCTLRGVSIPIASAILALAYPDSFCVIDFRIMNLFSNGHPIDFTSYYNYLSCVREVSRQFGLTPMKVDVALWQYDRDKN